MQLAAEIFLFVISPRWPCLICKECRCYLEWRAFLPRSTCWRPLLQAILVTLLFPFATLDFTNCGLEYDHFTAVVGVWMHLNGIISGCWIDILVYCVYKDCKTGSAYIMCSDLSNSRQLDYRKYAYCNIYGTDLYISPVLCEISLWWR